MSQLTKKFNSLLKDIAFTPDQQIVFLCEWIEHPDASASDKAWMRYKLRSLRSLYDSPSPRQRIVGNRRGSPTLSERESINILTQLNSIKSLLQDSYVR